MILKFVKMHGLGNDFAVFDCRDDAPTPDTGLLRRLADRRTGIGFDQLLVLVANVRGSVLGAVGLAFFLWTVRTGQYDDLEGPAHRILMDDDDPMVPGYKRNEKQQGKQAAEPNGRQGHAKQGSEGAASDGQE